MQKLSEKADQRGYMVVLVRNMIEAGSGSDYFKPLRKEVENAAREFPRVKIRYVEVRQQTEPIDRWIPLNQPAG
jgi:hypothetical protein